jgi:hypothetical protein
LTPVTDLRDTRTLVPRVRRALEGPDAPAGSAAIAEGALTDDQLDAAIADAIADVIFYTGGLFGHELVVTERDEDFMAPIAWLVEPALSEAEATVIVAQAALNHFFAMAKGMKVSEKISDEGQQWEYSFSPQVLTEQIKALQRARDEAIAVVKEQNAEALDAWVNLIEQRDFQTSQIIEPWLTQGPAWSGGYAGV